MWVKKQIATKELSNKLNLKSHVMSLFLFCEKRMSETMVRCKSMILDYYFSFSLVFLKLLFFSSYFACIFLFLSVLNAFLAHILPYLNWMRKPTLKTFVFSPRRCLKSCGKIRNRKNREQGHFYALFLSFFPCNKSMRNSNGNKKIKAKLKQN